MDNAKNANTEVLPIMDSGVPNLSEQHITALANSIKLDDPSLAIMLLVEKPVKEI